MNVVWTLRLTTQAELDFSEIVAWTAENFGEIQADTYAETLTLAIEALQDGTELLGARGTISSRAFEPCTWLAGGEMAGTLWCSDRPKINTSMCCVCFTTAWIWPDIFRRATISPSDIGLGQFPHAATGAIVIGGRCGRECGEPFAAADPADRSGCVA
jgi:hypothetical protein